MSTSLDALFENTGDCAWGIDQNQRIVIWNRAASQLFGLTAEEVVGRPCYQVMGGCTLDGVSHCRKNCAIVDHVRRRQVVEATTLVFNGRENGPIQANVSTLFFPENGKTGLLLIHLAHPSTKSSPNQKKLRIRLLGAIEVIRPDGTPVDGALWRRVKVRVLLAFLAMNRGKPIHRQTLIEAIWPEMPYESALHNLNTTIYSLRRSLEPGLKRGVNSRYVLYDNHLYFMDKRSNPWLDLAEFEAGVKRARSEKNPQKAIPLFLEALELYRGDLLAEVNSDLTWHWQEQDRVRELYLSAAESLASHYEAIHNAPLAIETYEKVLNADPTRESACMPLMRLLMTRGDRLTAIHVYQDLAKALRRELNVAPSLGLQWMHKSLLDVNRCAPMPDVFLGDKS